MHRPLPPVVACCIAGRCSPLPAAWHHPTFAGTVHSNGFGHLARLNGREGGSKRASGRQLMQVRLKDAVCGLLAVEGSLPP